MSIWDEVNTAVREAERLDTAAKQNSGIMARLLVGRLRSHHINGDDLRALKLELRDFNMVTGKWSPR